jgi:hypothetical protein
VARSLNPFLIRLSRWPRRIAALVCLLLAAASTLAPASGTSAPAPAKHVDNPIAAGLAPGQVAIPVTISSGRAAAFVHVGDHVGVLAPSDETTRTRPDLVADGLRVLAVSGAADSGGSMTGDAPVVVVAAGRADAVRLAAAVSRPLLVVVDNSP